MIKSNNKKKQLHKSIIKVTVVKIHTHTDTDTQKHILKKKLKKK